MTAHAGFTSYAHMPTASDLKQAQHEADLHEAAKMARRNLTMFTARIRSTVILPLEASPGTPAGTVLWRAELWNDQDDTMLASTRWERARSWAVAQVETLLQEKETELEAMALEELQ